MTRVTCFSSVFEFCFFFFDHINGYRSIISLFIHWTKSLRIKLAFPTISLEYEIKCFMIAMNFVKLVGAGHVFEFREMTHATQPQPA